MLRLAPFSHAMRRPLVVLLALAVPLAGFITRGAALGQEKPSKLLASKDPARRVEGARALAEKGGEDAEKLLRKALDDRDWEVVEWAAHGLGTHGSKDAVDELLKTALRAPVRRVRVSAARAVAKLDPEAALADLAKEVRKKTGLPAAEALAEICARNPLPAAVDAVEKALGSREQAVQDAAARAVCVLDESVILGHLAEWSSAGRLTAAANALEAIAARPGHVSVTALLELLDRRGLPPVIERRVLHAIQSAVRDGSDGDAQTRAAALLEAVANPADAWKRARSVRALDSLCRVPRDDDGRPGAATLPASVATSPLLAALEDRDDGVRAAAAHALSGTLAEDCWERLREVARSDSSDRVRRAAMRGVVSSAGFTPETKDLLVDRLERDSDERVREEAAVFLGRRECADRVDALIAALEDRTWTVGVCAAVSLGKTKSEAALEPLSARAENKDWKVAGAALAGLGHLDHHDAVLILIDALNAKHSVLKQTAYAFLRRLTAAEFADRQKPWREWWDGAKDSFTFVDREAEAKNAKKYGYATSTAGLYEHLDVTVLQSRGDHIEELLEKLGIEHRRTMAGNLDEAGLQPFGVFVSNCTGEITPADVEVLQWFTRAGGYLFCSCWALHHTAEPVSPGPVRKAATRGEVLDLVEARDCSGDEHALQGVFEPLVQPHYVLFGAHLIEVLEPETVAVLIDSPACAERWGAGDLACSFATGHGRIVDSANHFDLQGLESVEGLKKPEDRMAFAVDHMGLGYVEMREMHKRKVFHKEKTANEEIRDLSAFRFLSNFVREKRIADH